MDVNARLPSLLRPVTAVAAVKLDVVARLRPILRPVRALGRTWPAAIARLNSPLRPLSALAAGAVGALATVPPLLQPLSAYGRQPRSATQAAAARVRPRLLADPLPMRRGADLPGYRTDAVLPWVYGRVRLRPLPLDDAGLEWLLADHAIVSVMTVRDGAELLDGWDINQRMDATGTTVAVLRLARPPKEDLAVDLAGRPDATTGALIEHPADIAADLIARCGLAPGDWSALRSGWPGVTVGGVIDAAIPLRDALQTVISSLGAMWSAAPLRAWVPGSGPIIMTVGAAEADDASAEATADDLVSRLSVTWGWDWAAGEPRGSVLLEAAEVAAAIGQIQGELAAPWLRSARDAEALGRADLARRARGQWSISVTLGPGDTVRPGDRVALTHGWVPSGAAEIHSVDASQARRDLVLWRSAGALPRIDIVRRGALLYPQGLDQLAITYNDGVATFRILDSAGIQMANVAVTMDGINTQITDRQGRVQFTTHRGAHTLRVVAAGYADMYLDVMV